MESFLDYLNSGKIVDIYSISSLGVTIKKERVTLTSRDDWHGFTDNHTRSSKVVLIHFYDKNGRHRRFGYGAPMIRVIDCNNFKKDTFSFDGCTYYLDPTKPCGIVVDRLREKKRELDKKQMEAQKIAASWKK